MEYFILKSYYYKIKKLQNRFNTHVMSSKFVLICFIFLVLLFISLLLWIFINSLLNKNTIIPTIILLIMATICVTYIFLNERKILNEDLSIRNAQLNILIEVLRSFGIYEVKQLDTLILKSEKYLKNENIKKKFRFSVVSILIPLATSILLSSITSLLNIGIGINILITLIIASVLISVLLFLLYISFNMNPLYKKYAKFYNDLLDVKMMQTNGNINCIDLKEIIF